LLVCICFVIIVVIIIEVSAMTVHTKIAFTLKIATFCFIILIFLFSFLPNSTKNSADIQYRDEEQDEGSHDDGRCHILEVDFPEHFGLSYRDVSFPLEYGG